MQVVGRVNQGLDVLQLIGDVPCGPGVCVYERSERAALRLSQAL
jgi:hypothetical protein